MDVIVKKKSRNRWVIIGIAVAVLSALTALFWFVLRPALFRKDPVHDEPVNSEPANSEPVHFDPVHTDTVVYTIRETNDYATIKRRLSDFTYRNVEERKKWAECTETVEVKEAPYAWTGCYGDFNLSLGDWASEPDHLEVTISCYPGVKVVNDFAESLRVIEAGESICTFRDVWHFYFQDLNEDGFPELLVDGYEVDVFYIYDFVARKQYTPTTSDIWLSVSFDSVLEEKEMYTMDEYGNKVAHRVLGKFVLRDGVLQAEGFVDADAFSEAELFQGDPGEAVCVFDIDNGDAMKRRLLRLPEYEDVVLEVNKREVRQYFPNRGSDAIIPFYGATSLYLADLDSDGKREIYISYTIDHIDRRLIQLTYDEEKHEFVGQRFFADGDYTGLIPAEDQRYRSGARFGLENGKLVVKMFDTSLSYESEITAEIIDARQLSRYLKLDQSRETYSYDHPTSDDDPLIPRIGLKIAIPRGKAVMGDRQSWYVLPGVDRVISSHGFAFTGEGTVLAFPDFVFASQGLYRIVFADLNGDGRHEICVNDRFVLDPVSLQVIGALGSGSSFVFFRNDLYVVEDIPGEDYGNVSLASRILGRPVLRNGKLEVEPANLIEGSGN